MLSKRKDVRRFSVIVAVIFVIFYGTYNILYTPRFFTAVVSYVPVGILFLVALVKKSIETKKKGYFGGVISLVIALSAAYSHATEVGGEYNALIYYILQGLSILVFYIGFFRKEILLGMLDEETDQEVESNKEFTKFSYSVRGAILLFMFLIVGVYTKDATEFYANRLSYPTAPDTSSVYYPPIPPKPKPVVFLNDALNSTLEPMGDSGILTFLENGTGTYQNCLHTYKNFYTKENITSEYKSARCADDDVLVNTGKILLSHLGEIQSNHNPNINGVLGTGIIEDTNKNGREVYISLFYVTPQKNTLRNGDTVIEKNYRIHIIYMLPIENDFFVEDLTTNSIWISVSSTNGKKKHYLVQMQKNKDDTITPRGITEIINNNNVALLNNSFIDFTLMHPLNTVAHIGGFNPFSEGRNHTRRVEDFEIVSGKKPVYYKDRCIEPTFSDAQISFSFIDSSSSNNRIMLYAHKINSPVIYLANIDEYPVDVLDSNTKIEKEIQIKDYIQEIQRGISPQGKEANLEIIGTKIVRHILPSYDTPLCSYSTVYHQYQWIESGYLFNLVIGIEIYPDKDKTFPIDLINQIIKSLEVRTQ